MMETPDQVLEINDIDALEPFRDQWHALLAQSEDATFFHSLPWLKVYWKHFGSGQKLRVCIIRRDGQVRGIVPFVVKTEDKRIAKVRVLTFPLHDWGSFYGPVGPQPGQLLYTALKYIRTQRRDWDFVDLKWLRCDGDDNPASVVRGAMQRVGLRVHQRPLVETAVVDTSGSWDDYLASRKQKFRGSIRRYERRLAEHGEVTFVRYRPGGATVGDNDPRWQDYEACVAVAERSWQGSSSDGTTLSHDSIARYLRDAHIAAVDHGFLDLNLLQLDGRLLAFAYNYHYLGHVTGLRIGYDPDFAKMGAGKILWARSFQDSFERGDRLYDIGSESLSIKQNWLTRCIPTAACTYYPPLGPKPQLVRLGQWVKQLGFAPQETTAVGN